MTRRASDEYVLAFPSRKLKANDLSKNEQHALSTAQHMLFNDLRRTCHFSCTIEETTARIWCHTRSGTFVTQGFDIHVVSRPMLCHSVDVV